jgi:hypothetical protein
MAYNCFQEGLNMACSIFWAEQRIVLNQNEHSPNKGKYVAIQDENKSIVCAFVSAVAEMWEHQIRLE